MTVPVAAVTAVKSHFRESKQQCMAMMLVGKETDVDHGIGGAFVLSRVVHVSARASTEFSISVENPLDCHDAIGAGECIIGLVFARPLQPLPLDADAAAFKAVKDVDSHKSANMLLLLLTDGTSHKFLTTSSPQSGASTGWTAYSFLHFKDDGTKPNQYKPALCGGNTFLEGSVEMRKCCMEFVATAHKDMLSSVAGIPTAKLHINQVDAALVAAAQATLGLLWPLTAAIAWPSSFDHALTNFVMPGSAPWLWLMIAQTPLHWALVCVRKPCGKRKCWDAVLADSLPSAAMEEQEKCDC